MLLFKIDRALLFIIVYVIHRGFCPPRVSIQKLSEEEMQKSEYNIKVHVLL